MSPEKVAILVVAGLIAVLLAVALLGTESNGNGSAAPPEKPKAPPERPKPAPKQIEAYTYEDIVKGGRDGPRPEAKPASAETRPEATTTEYVVKKDDTLEKIARRELGSRELRRAASSRSTRASILRSSRSAPRSRFRP